MTKTRYKILSVFTLGVLPLIVKNKAKALAGKNNDTLTYSTVIDFDINQFYNFLGQRQNIASLTATLNTLIVVVRNKINVTTDQLARFKIKGFNCSIDNKYIFVFGNNSLAIRNKLIYIITHPTPTPVINNPARS
jgi:phosphotransferase system IIB component